MIGSARGKTYILKSVLIAIKMLLIIVFFLFLNLNPSRASVLCNKIGGLSFGLALEMLGQPTPADASAVESFVSRLEDTANEIDAIGVQLLPDDDENAVIAARIRRYAELGDEYKPIRNRFGAEVGLVFYRSQIAQPSIDYLNSVFRSMDCTTERYREETARHETRDGNERGDDLAERRPSRQSRAVLRFREPKLDERAAVPEEQSNTYFYSLLALALVALVTQEFFENRRAVRHDVNFDTRLLTDMGNFPARVRNISSTGAKLCWMEELDPGTSTVIDLGEDLIRAIVVWNRGGHTGVRFAKKLTKKQLKSFVHKAAETG